MNEIISISFLFPNVVSGVINLIIFFLLFLAITVGWRTIRRYKGMERKHLRLVRNRVDAKLSQQSSGESGNPEQEEESKEIKKGEKTAPDLLMDVEGLREFVEKESIIYKRIDTIERMRKFRVKINVDYLQQAALTAEASRLGVSLPKFSTGMAMILGLFGTFIGLALMVTKISMLMPDPGAADLSISTLKSSMADMETVFQGIKTAFSTSIAGICATLVCLMLDYRIRRAQTSFFHELEIFTVEKLIPVTVPPVESEHLLEEVSFQLQDSFNTLNHIITQNNETLNNLNTVETSFKTIVDQVRDITRREESRNFENVLGLLADNNKSLVRLVELWPKMASTLKGNSQALISSMKRQQMKFDEELNRILQIRKGGAVINIPRLSNFVIIISLVVIFIVILINVLT